MKTRLLALVLLILLVVPLCADYVLWVKDLEYSGMAARWEVRHFPVLADFGRQGTLFTILIDTTEKRQQLVVQDRSRELLRLPFDSTDNTLRTHVGIVSSGDRCTLAVYTPAERAQDQSEGRIYQWNGQAFLVVDPTDLETAVLASMRARDDSGTWTEWALYRLLRLPFLIGYYCVLCPLVVARIASRRSRELDSVTRLKDIAR